jgi:hypothetical protein
MDQPMPLQLSKLTRNLWRQWSAARHAAVILASQVVDRWTTRPVRTAPIHTTIIIEVE